MYDGFKKFCACGALGIVVVSATPLCKECLEKAPSDLPAFSYDFQDVGSNDTTALSASVTSVTPE